MKKRLLFASTTIVILSGIGNNSGISPNVNSLTDHLLAHESSGEGSPNSMMPEEGMHNHKTMEIPVGLPVPSVDLIVHPDVIRGWNLEVKVSNFRFAPEKINQESNAQEGHAHLYINGEKLTRLYGSWYYLASLNPGQHKITVTLNANGHEELVHNNQRIEDAETIEVSPTAN
jgi:hypothetical protein